ncbi:MAG: methyltransferase domain-containing protein, partial [Candidatus Omnitrophota bacterium]
MEKKYQKINLGCGKKIRKGYLNLDFVKAEGVDVVHDLNQYPWPFQDDTFDEIYASHLLEHILDFRKAMEETRRICKNKAKVTI